MIWSITGDRPVYLQLIEQMERAIVAGEYGAGARLPAVRDLAAEAAVNPNTMQRALQELEARGLVHTQRTAGRTVTEDAARIAQLRAQLALRQAEAFLAAMRALGYEKAETLTLLEGLDPLAADAPGSAANAPDIFAKAPDTFAGTSNAFADAPNANAAASNPFAKPSRACKNAKPISTNTANAGADAQNIAADSPDISANSKNLSANTSGTPSHSTGRK